MPIQSMNSLNPDTAAAQSPSDFAGREVPDGVAGSLAVCIVGMHRSGTSMVAELLYSCGVYLGSAEDLAPPSLDNPGGFWENQHFVTLNDALIAKRGGQWNDPPKFTAGWEDGSEVLPLQDQASKLIESFRSHRNWGWKDPRSSLTIAFWRRLIPGLKVVVCIRNPVEVSHSLFVRGDTASVSEFELWLNYYREILAAVPAAQRMVTHYESYFHDARAELERLSHWLGLQVSDENLDRACARVSAELRHHHVTTGELNQVDVPPEVRELYETLCAEAGPVCQQIAESTRSNSEPPSPGQPIDGSKPLRIQAIELESWMARRDRQIKLLEIELAAARAKLETHQAQLESLKPIIRFLNALRSLRARFRRS